MRTRDTLSDILSISGQIKYYCPSILDSFVAAVNHGFLNSIHVPFPGWIGK
jgi:hypothetical protein